MKNILPILIFFFCLVKPSSTHGQQISFTSYTVQDGLVANPVHCIYQDSAGFIWIGTYEGLSRYDGYKFTNYTVNNGLSHNLINAVFEVDGYLLIAENNGAIDRINNNQVNNWLKLPSSVNKIQPYKHRILIATDRNGIYEYSHKKLIQLRQPKTGKPVGHLVAFNDSLLVSDAVDNDLYILRNDFSVHSGIVNTGLYFYDFFKDSKNRMWACTSGGLKLLGLTSGNNSSLVFDGLPAIFKLVPVNNVQVTSIVEEKDGSFWIGTHKGLIHLFPDGQFRLYGNRDGLPSASIYTIFRDRENNLWIGTALGLAKWVSTNHITFLNNGYKNFENDVNNIFSLKNNLFVLKTEHGPQLFNFPARTFTNIQTEPGIAQTPIINSWPFTFFYPGHIGKLDVTRNIVVPTSGVNKAIPAAFVAIEISPGVVLMGTGTGLYASGPTGMQKILPYRITTLVTDNAKNVWVGTWQNGLYKIVQSPPNGSELTATQIDQALLKGNKEIRALHIDSKNNVWVGTRYDGVFRLSPKVDAKTEVTHINHSAGLISDWIYCFAEAANGDMWVGSYQGLDRIVKQANGSRVFNFSKVANFFATIEDIILPDKEHLICVANDGIAYFKDENIHLTPPLITSIVSASLGTAGNMQFFAGGEENTSLKPNQNTARFEFNALGFTNEKQVMYRYRLRGSLDTAWSEAANKHEAVYISLPPGHYSFEVKTMGWNGQDGIPATFPFAIETPFWKQWWFILLGVLVISLLFYSLYRYRISQILRLQNVRNRIATDLHDDIGSTLTNISILSELSNKHLEQPEKLQLFNQRIGEEVRASSQAMDDIIWSVNSRHDSLNEMLARMRRYAAELFDNSDTNCKLQLEENTDHQKLSMEQRRDVYLIYKEALNNIYKHANAKAVSIKVFQSQNSIVIQIRDDGTGFDPSQVSERNGLKNLHSRVKKWKGRIMIQSADQEGTLIDISIPLKN